MKFEGKQHRGRDDSRNIARIAIRLIEDGCRVKVNEIIHNYPGAKYLKFAPVDAESTDSDDGDVDDTDDKTKVKKEKVKVQGSISTDIDKGMSTLCIEDLGDNSEEDVSDLMTYYKLQKS